MVCLGVTDEILGEKLVLLIEYNPTVEEKKNLIQRINTFPFENHFTNRKKSTSRSNLQELKTAKLIGYKLKKILQ
jgi:hypothetical protein